MNLRMFRQALRRGLVAGIMLSVQPGVSWAASLTVNPGYDLFTTVTDTTFPGLGPLKGVPLGNFDFGAGAVPVGNADTIEHRLNAVTVAAAGDTGTTNIEMSALQLETVAPVNFAGNGVDNYFFTLQSARGGPATTGSMNITFLSTAGGTFASFFDVFFDIRKGSISGPIVFSDQLTATNQGANWTRIVPPGAVTIPGVNFHLNGTDNDRDFWPATPLQFTYPGGGVHALAIASVPEPSTWLMCTMGAFMLLAYRLRRGK